MIKSSNKCDKELILAITILAEIVRELDPGRVRQYDEIAGCLEKARGYMVRADALEH